MPEAESSDTLEIRRLAVLNRGEAAMRCIRAVKAMRAAEGSGMRCIALYTDADRDAPFVRHADTAIRLKTPGASAVSAYLDHDGLLAALLQSGADAVWPGWGFVAEDPAFVDRLQTAGLRFLGPPAAVMRAVGDKIGSKHAAEQAGVPVIPWNGGALADLQEAHSAAQSLGYPLMLKASAGGGGRGIRRVPDAGVLAEAFESARIEARSAFGDDRLFFETLLSGGRHVEVQIAADSFGNTRALGCRDCSVQRRHQKVLEEAPPPGLSAELIAELQACSERLARAVEYVGVGTVEYLVSDEGFAFLEVNPRLQVEHGITEEITGIDLVQLQIRIARGEALPPPSPPSSRHSIEARVCAEDPEADFLPAPGHIVRFEPALGPGIRVDTGLAVDCEVPPDFDSLIAKVIATGETRDEARARLRSALVESEIVLARGATNKGFLIGLLANEIFRDAQMHTGWLDAHPELRESSREFAVEALISAAILAYQSRRESARQGFFGDPTRHALSAIPASDGQRIDLNQGAHGYSIEVFAIGAWRYRLHMEGRVVQVRLRTQGDCASTLEWGDRTLRVLHDITERGLRVEVEGRPARFASELAGQVRAGTPAMVVAVRVEAGERVTAGQSLGSLEAMKMEIGFEAPLSGVVKAIHVQTGQQVAAGELLLSIEPDADEEEATGGHRIELPLEKDPLELFFGADAETPDLCSADSAPAERRADAVRTARDEIRRVLMGYDVNLSRGERLAAILETPLPPSLSEDFRREFAEIRHELGLFADVEELFSRAPQPTPSGDPGPSNHVQLRDAVRRISQEGSEIHEPFRATLERVLAHYGVDSLQHSEELERALLRVLASQLAPELRQRLVVGCVRRCHELAESGIDLAGDTALGDALARTTALRGLVSDALADCAVEARYAIFEGPRLKREVERTTKTVEAWLKASADAVREPPEEVLSHLASAPAPVFDRVGRWLEDSDPRRRATAVAAHMRRLYAPQRPTSHTSATVGPAQLERLDFAGERIVLGSVAHRAEIAPILERLGRAARAAAVRNENRRVAAIELLVPVSNDDEFGAVRETVAPLLRGQLSTERLSITLLPSGGTPTHYTWLRTDDGLREERDLHGIHPETASRIDLARLQNFELKRLEAPEDLYCFQLQSRSIPGDERLFVLADVRTRSPDDEGHEASLHVPAFERGFFEATRCARSHLSARDPRRRLQWNRLMLFAEPAIYLDAELVERLSRRLAPATRHLGLEKVIVRLNVLDRDAPQAEPRPVEIVIADPTGSHLEFSWREPHHEPLEPAQDYERRVVEARRRRLVYPYEIIRVLTGAEGALDLGGDELPVGRFEEYDLETEPEPGQRPRAHSVAGRAPAHNSSAVVFGIVETPTEEVPEGMRRVLLLSDPTIGMGSLAAAECDRIVAALDLAEQEQLPVEWVPVSSGARIAMESGTENLDATARVVRRIVTFTQGGGTIHVIVHGVNVGAQSYFDALATMLQHTRGALIMTPRGSMVLTGRAALEASGSVSAEDEAAIAGFERVMGPNGEGQYYARNLVEAYALLYHHYRFSYVVPGEAGPRRIRSGDPGDRLVTEFTTEPSEGHDFSRVGEIFDGASNPDRKRPFAMRALMQAVIDQDTGHLERWRAFRGAETAIVWDSSLGGHPVCLIGIESRNLSRGGEHAADGPTHWTGGTLFPRSSKKVARALDAASGNRPVVVLANLSGFDGSPESMRELQLEYGAEIARAVVNFQGPLLFLVVSRYHGGAYVVFSRALNESLHAAAVEGSFASVIGGGPAAAVVFSREARARASREPRVVELRRHAQETQDVEARDAFEAAWQAALLEKQAELAAEFDAIHSVERAREVGSLERIVGADEIRPYLIALLEGESS